MARRKGSFVQPSYRRHRASGQAVVTIGGKDHYLGKFNSPASREEYDRLIGEWLSNGRQIPEPSPQQSITVSEVIARYWGVVKNMDQRRDAISNYRQHLKRLNQTYGDTK